MIRLERKGSPLTRRRLETALNAEGPKGREMEKALGGADAVQELHARWEKDPSSVSEELKAAADSVFSS